MFPDTISNQILMNSDLWWLSPSFIITSFSLISLFGLFYREKNKLHHTKIKKNKAGKAIETVKNKENKRKKKNKTPKKETSSIFTTTSITAAFIDFPRYITSHYHYATATTTTRKTTVIIIIVASTIPISTAVKHHPHPQLWPAKILIWWPTHKEIKVYKISLSGSMYLEGFSRAKQSLGFDIRPQLLLFTPTRAPTARNPNPDQIIKLKIFRKNIGIWSILLSHPIFTHPSKNKVNIKLIFKIVKILVWIGTVYVTEGASIFNSCL